MERSVFICLFFFCFCFCFHSYFFFYGRHFSDSFASTMSLTFLFAPARRLSFRAAALAAHSHMEALEYPSFFVSCIQSVCWDRVATIRISLQHLDRIFFGDALIHIKEARFRHTVARLQIRREVAILHLLPLCLHFAVPSVGQFGRSGDSLSIK